VTGAERNRHIRLIREQSEILEPLPVALPPEWAALPKGGEGSLEGVRAVIFDVYGTLFVSRAGDIAGADTAGMNAAGEGFSETAPMKAYFTEEVRRRHEEARSGGEAWPEVDAGDIWAAYRGPIPGAWEEARRLRRILERTGGSPPRPGRVLGRCLALRYELAVNPVYPMPGAEEVLRSLAARGLALGIISNAQFYTPLLFDAFFGASPEALGFDPALVLYSFAEGIAKPSPELFARSRRSLLRRGIAPEEALYIGNDMRNDIVPAAEAGFKTALFAGDRRSLRLREEDPRCVNQKPRVILEDLRALLPAAAGRDQARDDPGRYSK
jgi:putative hydrolase of the HAD superfamily